MRFNYEKVDEFLPCLAVEWTVRDISETSPEGLTWQQRYTFRIRQDVRFHDGSLLTTEDVEYSFERWMVQDRLGGPAWLTYEPLLDVYAADLADPAWGQKIDSAVQRNATHVWLNLVTPYAPFLQILSQSWSSILNKEFCTAHGCWPGTWENWQDYHNPDVSPLDTAGDWMCRTGPYKLDYWTHGNGWYGEYSLIKFDEYWQGWPASDCSRYVSSVLMKFIPPWPVKKEMFLNGTADIIYVPRVYAEELEGQPGIRYIKDLPLLSVNAIFFNFNISSASPYVGSGQLESIRGKRPTG